MTTPSFFAWPILPGKQEAWRRFCQELCGWRGPAYAASRRRLDVQREQLWLTHTGRVDLVIGYVETSDPERFRAAIRASDRPFERWYRNQIFTLHGIDLREGQVTDSPELVLDWSASGATANALSNLGASLRSSQPK